MANVFTSLVRVGSVPEIRFTPSGKSVLSFSAASTTGYGDNKKTLWVRVSYWNNPEKIKEFISKGTQLVVSGELTLNEYQANDGTTKTSLELNCNVVDLAGGKKDNAPPMQQPQAEPQINQDNANSTATDYDDDIPF